MNITKETVDYTKIYEIPANDPDIGSPELEVKIHRNCLNRAINISHVKEIRSAITPMNWKNFSPIEININTWNILDGQHRWQAFATLDEEIKNQVKLRIQFLDIPANEEIEVIRDKNTKNKNWTTKAFAESSKAAGNCKEINMLYQFCENHEKCHKIKKDGSIGAPNLGYGMAFLWGAALPGKCIRSGHFEAKYSLSQRKVELADALYREVDKLIGALGYTKTSTWYERFAQAWYFIHNDPECGEQLRDIGLTNVCNNLKNHPINQLTTNTNDWISYFKEVGLGMNV